MKTKLIACFSAVLLMVGVACQTAPPRPPEPPIQPYYPPLPDKCPVARLEREIPALCCLSLCENLNNAPAAHYRRCQQKVLNEYSCNVAEQTIIDFQMFSACRCGH